MYPPANFYSEGFHNITTNNKFNSLLFLTYVNVNKYCSKNNKYITKFVVFNYKNKHGITAMLSRGEYTI